MTALQRIQLAQSELRSKIAEELGKEESDKEALAAMTKEMNGLEIELRSAMLIEESTAIPDTVETPEGRELRELHTRSSIQDYFNEAAFGVPVAGASLEYRQATLGENRLNTLPLEMLLPAEDVYETRADAVTNIATAIQENQMAIAGRVFARTAAAYLGVSFPSVSVGTQTYPRLTAGTTADVRDTGVELDGTAATLTTESINPVRFTASYTFSRESLVKVVGFEDALRTDLNNVLDDQMDKLVINGKAAVSNTSPAVEGVISSLTDPTDPSDVATWSTYLGAYDDHVDGMFATSSEQVRMLVNDTTYKQAALLEVGTNGNSGLLRDRLPMDRFRVSAHMPPHASNINTAISYATGAGSEVRGLIAPTWAGLDLITDPYTGAKKGEIALTAILMVGFGAVDMRAYKRIEFKTA